MFKNKNKNENEVDKSKNFREVSIGRYINDKREPNATMLASIANALNVSTDYLLGRPNTHKTLQETKSKAEKLEEDFPEGVSVLYRANKNLTPEQKEVMLRMIKATFFEDEDK